MQFWELEDELVNSIVGSGTEFKGDIVLSGIFRVDGDFIGSIRNEGKVIVGRSARSACVIEAATVVIGGLFRGSIWASEKVVLLSSAIVIATISTPHLVVERGCLLDGNISVEPVNALRDKKKNVAIMREGKLLTIRPGDKHVRIL